MSEKLAPVNQPVDWSPESWQRRDAIQQANYPDEQALSETLEQLRRLPPLVTSWEVLKLREQLEDVHAGRRFLLWGGDCAESFEECRPDVITNRLKVLLQMSLVLVHGLKLPVVRVGRFAGQYAKPRSADLEQRGDESLPSYRGDLVNGVEFTPESRVPDPTRLLKAHARSAMTMNFVRGLVDGGFADLHHPEYWDLSWMEHSPLAQEYGQMVQSLGESLKFMEALTDRQVGSANRAEFFTSHEALHLHYEQGQTREVPHHWGWFNLSTHFPWIGMRTADLDQAHVEYFRGIRNPIAVKVGPKMTADWLRRLMDLLNPANEPGRLALIHRMGADDIAEHLPSLIETVKSSGQNIVWVCDPMHGNTESTSGGVKTRRFDKIRQELEQAFDIHQSCGTRLGGVHLELTGENVTECLGGARALDESDLQRAYSTKVDPRLNYEQALEMALVIVRKRSGGG